MCSFPALRFSEAVTRSDRKSTRLNSSHLGISYAVFCLKKNPRVARPRPHRRLVLVPSRPDLPERAARRREQPLVSAFFFLNTRAPEQIPLFPRRDALPA